MPLIDLVLKELAVLYQLENVEFLEEINIGFDSKTYKLRSQDQIYYLSGSNYPDIEKAREQQFKWASFLRNHDLPVIDIIKTIHGLNVFPFDGFIWYLMKEADGKSVSDYNAGQSYQLGYVTGLLHKVSATYEDKNPFDPHYYNQYIQHWHELYQQNQNLFSEQERSLIDQKFEWCRSVEMSVVPFFFTHNDLFKTNILWSNDHISCLIDFNSSKIAYYTEDFAKAFDSVITDKTANSSNAVRFMEGYSKNFKLRKENIDSVIFFLTVDLLKIVACWCRDFEKISKQGKHPRNLLPHFDYIADKEQFLLSYYQ